MTVKELVEKYEKNNRIDIAKTLEVNKYASIMLKRKMANLVLEGCTTIVDGVVHIDSIERYMLFVMATISMHTNLEFSHNDDEEYSVIDDYDMLCESGLLVKIIDTFSDDYASCQEILNMMTADRLQDNMTIEKKLSMFLDDIRDLLGNTISGLVDKLNVEDLVKDAPMDLGKLSNLLKLIK